MWGSESSMYEHHHVHDDEKGAANETRNSMYFYPTFAPKDGWKNGDYDSMCYHLCLYMSWVAFFVKELDLLFLTFYFWSFVCLFAHFGLGFCLFVAFYLLVLVCFFTLFFSWMYLFAVKCIVNNWGAAGLGKIMSTFVSTLPHNYAQMSRL